MLFLFFLFCHFGNHLRARCCARVAQSQLHIVSEKRSFWRFSFPQPSDGCESRPHLWQFFDRTIGADLSANYIPLPGCCDKSWSMCWAPTRGSKFPSFCFVIFFFGVKVCTRLGGSLTGFIICARMGVNRCQTEICIFVSSTRPCCPLTRVCIGTAT